MGGGEGALGDLACVVDHGGEFVFDAASGPVRVFEFEDRLLQRPLRHDEDGFR